MQRDCERLAAATFDLVIVGGGIYGACAAREAALRGLSVALLEQGDFGGATSANSQKIIHGGLRYLQSLDLKRMRESIRERRTLLSLAPHLVHPLPVLMPTRGLGRRNRAVIAAALAANELLSWDRNRGIDEPAQRIPAGRTISRLACLRLAPQLDGQPLSGAALWHDAQVEDSERLTLAFVRSAVEAGAAAANYVKVTGLKQEGARVTGVHAEDVLTGRAFQVGAGMVLNTRGPWSEAPPRQWLKAVSLVVDPLLTQGVALGIDSSASAGLAPGLLFITPWQGRSILGTAYLPYDGRPEDCRVTEDEIAALLQAVNAALPETPLKRPHVKFAYVGLIPAAAGSRTVAETRYQLIDHRRQEGLEGLVSVVGVKYTTARDVAEKTVDLICAKLGQGKPKGCGRTAPLAGAPTGLFSALLEHAQHVRLWGLERAVIQRLVRRYGAAYADVLRLIRESLAWREPVDAGRTVLKAEVIYAIRQEMAQTLGDVVFRRTGLGSAGFPGWPAIQACAEVMAGELGWDGAHLEQELREVGEVFDRHGVVVGPVPSALPEAAERPLTEPVGVGSCAPS